MAQPSQLLLFDPDPSGLDTLTSGFEKEGYSVTGTVDPIKAGNLIQGANPALLVVRLGDSPQAGIDLLRASTSNPRTRNVPCVAIGREDHRSAALAAGAFALLAEPLFVRDVIAACRLVAAASLPGSRPSPDTDLSMTLGDVVGIYFLIRALAVTGRSAVVKVRHDQIQGELRFINGTLTSADVGPVQGLPALHHMLLWEDAVLNFKFKNVVRRGSQLSLKSSEVLEECDRFLRDFAHEAKGLGLARTRYAAESGGVQPSAALPSEVVPILRLFDGQRDLSRVLGESPFRIFDTLKIIKRFVRDGAIRLKTAIPESTGDAGPTPIGPGALDTWLQKRAPAFGPELGGVRNAREGSQQISPAPAGSVAVGVTASHRPSSPFVAVGGSGAATNNNTGTGGREMTTPKTNVGDAPPEVVANVITAPPMIRSKDDPPKRAPAVIRGEIRIAPPTTRKREIEPHSNMQSVMVELGALPAPVPLASAAPPPVTARIAPPSVIIAPMTPQPSLIQAAPSPAPPVESQPKRPARSPSDSFSVVEADFFEREADLYKRDSVESFDDLDGASRPNGPFRKG